ncbi:hypothetical protein [Sphingomonas sp. CLY1604]|uniref:hypothetical protein n=1 Tax=Sphingomonas sp. CLY1604 TaxID=3457786 RepID=UPI003FD88A4E
MSADIRLLRWHHRDREDYERLAAALERVRAAAARGRGEIVAPVPTGPEEPEDVDRARVLLAQRRARDAAAGPLAEMFGEPGWDILLNLFIAFEAGEAMRPQVVADAIGLRPAVLARWIDVLTDRGLIRAIAADPDTPSTLSLTDSGTALVLRCLGSV